MFWFLDFFGLFIPSLLLPPVITQFKNNYDIHYEEDKHDMEIISATTEHWKCSAVVTVAILFFMFLIHFPYTQERERGEWEL